MSSKFLDNFPTGAPARCEKVWDFLGDEELTEFVVTALGTGAATVENTEKNGAMKIAGAATTDNSGAEVQADAAWIKLEAGDRYRIEGRFYLDEATSANVETESDLWFGIATVDTDILTAVTDAIYFRKDDGDAYLDCQVTASGSSVTGSTGMASLADDTWYRLGIDIQMDASVAAKGTVSFYVDGTQKASLTVTGLPTGMMAPFVIFQSGDNTGTKHCLVDYIAVSQDR
jgi:hypothetical protein